MDNARLFRVFPDFSEIFFQIQYDHFNIIARASCMMNDDDRDALTQTLRALRGINTIKT